MKENGAIEFAKIKVFGIGGGGNNAVNRMVEEGVQGPDFYVANTDIQVLNMSLCDNKIVLGKEITKGLGAGADPEVGKKAAVESESEIREAIKGADMVFLATGLGGGTGTGATPLFAKIAKEEGALTVAIVTRPFSFEGSKRTAVADAGLAELREFVDSIIIISNNSLIAEIGRKPLPEAFLAADNVLRQGVQTITDLIAVPAYINLDFADVRTTMENQGAALIGIGMAEGEDKATIAAQKAIQSPLLEAKIKGARKVILNITGGESITLYDAEEAMELVSAEAGNNIDVILGVAINEKLGDQIIVTVIATGFEEQSKGDEIHIPKVTPQSTSSVVEDKVVEVEDIEEESSGFAPRFFKR